MTNKEFIFGWLVFCFTIFSMVAGAYILKVDPYNFQHDEISIVDFSQNEIDGIEKAMNQALLTDVIIYPGSTQLFRDGMIFIDGREHWEHLGLFFGEYKKGIERLDGCGFGYKVSVSKGELNFFKTKFFENRCFTLDEAKTVIIEQVRKVRDIAVNLNKKRKLEMAIANTHQPRAKQ
jgi:hypothetical protein